MRGPAGRRRATCGNHRRIPALALVALLAGVTRAAPPEGAVGPFAVGQVREYAAEVTIAELPGAADSSSGVRTHRSRFDLHYIVWGEHDDGRLEVALRATRRSHHPPAAGEDRLLFLSLDERDRLADFVGYWRDPTFAVFRFAPVPPRGGPGGRMPAGGGDVTPQDAITDAGSGAESWTVRGERFAPTIHTTARRVPAGAPPSEGVPGGLRVTQRSTAPAPALAATGSSTLERLEVRYDLDPRRLVVGFTCECTVAGSHEESVGSHPGEPTAGGAGSGSPTPPGGRDPGRARSGERAHSRGGQDPTAPPPTAPRIRIQVAARLTRATAVDENLHFQRRAELGTLRVTMQQVHPASDLEAMKRYAELLRERLIGSPYQQVGIGQIQEMIAARMPERVPYATQLAAILATRGDPVPPFVADTLDGPTFDLEALQGDPVVILVTACRDEQDARAAQELEEVTRRYHEELRGVVVCGAESAQHVRRFVAEQGITLPVIPELPSLFEDLSISMTPVLLFLDRDGNLVDAMVGFSPVGSRDLLGAVRRLRRLRR